MLIELINYEIKNKEIQYNFFRDGKEESLTTKLLNDNYMNYDFALKFIQESFLNTNNKEPKKYNYLNKTQKLNKLDISLIGYTKYKKIIDYTYKLNDETKTITIKISNKDKDYTDEQEALKLIKRKLPNLIIEKKLKEDSPKKKQKKEKVIYPTVVINKKTIIYTKEPELIKTSNEELNKSLEDITKINNLSHFILIKETLEWFSKKLYSSRKEISEEEKKNIIKIYSYYYNIHFKSKKTRDRVNEFLENSEANSMIKIILNIF